MSNLDWTDPKPGSQNQQFNPAGQYPSYGYQPQYGAYPPHVAPQYVAPQYGAWQSQAQPPDYRGWVIAAVAGGVLCSLLIGMPLGLIAQRNSRRVRSRWESGDHQGAVNASRSARSWAIAAVIFDVLGLLLAIVVLTHTGQPTG